MWGVAEDCGAALGSSARHRQPSAARATAWARAAEASSPLSRGALEEIRSTNPLQRLNKDIKRRTGVVGIIRNPEVCLGSLTPLRSRPTTYGRSATADISSRLRWRDPPGRRPTASWQHRPCFHRAHLAAEQ